MMQKESWPLTSAAERHTKNDHRLNCPFCGCNNVSSHEQAGVTYHFCYQCGAQGPMTAHGLMDSRLRWNTRNR
jgi:transcription elongation factor Elf1